MAVDDSFNKQFFNNFLWKKFRIEKAKTDLTFEEIANRVWVSYTYIVNMFNGRQIASIGRWESIGEALWVSSSEFEKIFKEAREAEYEYTTWLPISWLDLDEYEMEELLKVVFSKEWKREPTQQDMETILSVIRSMR